MQGPHTAEYIHPLRRVARLADAGVGSAGPRRRRDHASVRSLALVNLAAALVSAVVYWRGRDSRPAPVSSRMPLSTAYIVGVCLLAAGVLVLNAMRPVLAADPYHLDRMAQIERFGTIAYDLA